MNVCHMEICAYLSANAIHHSFKRKIHTFLRFYFEGSITKRQTQHPTHILTRFIHLHAAKMILIIFFFLNANLRTHFEICDIVRVCRMPCMTRSCNMSTCMCYKVNKSVQFPKIQHSSMVILTCWHFSLANIF